MYFVKDYIDKRVIQYEYYAMSSMPADLLAKPWAPMLAEKICKRGEVEVRLYKLKMR